MASQKRGRQSFVLAQPPVITTWANVAGKKEVEGPLSHTFDIKCRDAYFGQKTWEQAEKQMQQLALRKLAEKAGLTMAESLLMASMSVGGGFADTVVAMTSSHFASSERQYRFPLGYGGQRTPTSQWTVTGSGAALVRSEGKGPKITACTIGTVTDLGIKDANNMGAAMAPAALSTIKAHFSDLHTGPEDFDRIITGDLGQVGMEMLLELARLDGLSLGGKLMDCGTTVFDNTVQDVHSGGSGCGCSAVTLCGYLLGQLNSGKLKKILFCGTGALLSPTSTQQGLPIPGVCHAVSITGGR